MTRDEYIEVVNAVIKHDKMISRVRDVSRDLAKEVGGNFGGIAIIPNTGLREAFIRLIEVSCGDTSRNTSYLFDECLAMRDGGLLILKDGTKYPITGPEDCWDAIQAFERSV